MDKWSPQDKLASTKVPPRSVKRVAGGYIADMVALSKSIALCWKCRPKFAAKKHGYEHVHFAADPVSGCDGCRDPMTTTWLYMPAANARQMRGE